MMKLQSVKMSINLIVRLPVPVFWKVILNKICRVSYPPFTYRYTCAYWVDKCTLWKIILLRIFSNEKWKITNKQTEKYNLGKLLLADYTPIWDLWDHSSLCQLYTATKEHFAFEFSSNVYIILMCVFYSIVKSMLKMKIRTQKLLYCKVNFVLIFEKPLKCFCGNYPVYSVPHWRIEESA